MKNKDNLDIESSGRFILDHENKNAKLMPDVEKAK